jgi:uncharacterized protein
MAVDIKFDWDSENKKHLAANKVTPVEAEQLPNSEPLDLTFEVVRNEERYRSVGATNSGRILVIVWTIRDGKIRVITAFPAGVSDKKAFLERYK